MTSGQIAARIGIGVGAFIVGIFFGAIPYAIQASDYRNSIRGALTSAIEADPELVTTTEEVTRVKQVPSIAELQLAQAKKLQTSATEPLLKLKMGEHEGSVETVTCGLLAAGREDGASDCFGSSNRLSVSGSQDLLEVLAGATRKVGPTCWARTREARHDLSEYAESLKAARDAGAAGSLTAFRAASGAARKQGPRTRSTLDLWWHGCGGTSSSLDRLEAKASSKADAEASGFASNVLGGVQERCATGPAPYDKWVCPHFRRALKCASGEKPFDALAQCILNAGSGIEESMSSYRLFGPDELFEDCIANDPTLGSCVDDYGRTYGSKNFGDPAP